MKLYAILFALFIFTGLDIIFINLNGTSFMTQIKDVQKSPMKSMNIVGSIGAYICLFLGLYWFILREHRSPIEAGILGGVINGTYEFTNYTFFNEWHIETVIKDTVWGCILWSMTTWLTYLIFPK
jgi:uncharacterized membrane protein